MTRPNPYPLIAGAGVAVAVAVGAAWQMLRRPLPSPSGQRPLAPLRAPVEVLADGRGVPHLYAADEHDLFVAQGYTMARERLFQMDFLRRVASGRVSEWAGEATLALDRWQRVLGLRRSAERAWPHASDDAARALVAFSEGVNAALDEALARDALPVEYRLLGTVPERWTPVDSLAILRLVAFSLNVGWEGDRLREALRDLLGEEAAEGAIPLPPPDSPLIAAPGLAALRGVLGGPGAGSNAWAVDGSRSATGLPLLANDPHLSLRLPPVWFLQHLDCPTLAAAGAALVGVPGIMLGHNEAGAWGLTSGYADVQDLYIEERVPMADGSLAFRWGGESLPATVLQERITVKGRAEAVAQPVILTRHGPLLSELLPDEPRDLALRSTLDEPDNVVGALLGMNRAASWAEFRRALADLGTPPLNFVWADRAGTIGWIQAGRLPLRQGARGVVPVDGSTGENEWLGYIPLDELPQRLNPETGYLVHANNRPVGEEYPHWLGVDFMPGFRAARIAALIEARATHDAASFRAIQGDCYSAPEHRLAQMVGGLPPLPGPLRQAQQLLQAWDGQMGVESVGATVAHELFHQLRHALVSDKLASWSARWQGKVNHVDLQSVLPHAFNSWAWLLARLEDPADPWWNQAGSPRREGRDERLEQALAQSVAHLRAALGDDPARWTWGRRHARAIEHPLGALPGIGRLFRRGPFPLPGSAFSINADLATVQRFQDLPPVGSSVRLIADVSDWDRFLVALPGGNSGHPASPHFADGLAAWRRNEPAPLPWSRAAVEQASRARLLLEPPGEGAR